MAKITLENGMVIEGTIEELKQMGMKFPVEAEEQSPKYKQIDGADVRVGDFVKFIDYKCDTTAGRYYEITGFDSDGDPTFKDDEDDTAFVFTHDDDAEFYRLVAGTSEEQAEEVAEEEPELKVGDYVRVSIPDGSYPHYGWGDVNNGEVGKVKSVYESKVVVDFENHRGWNGKPAELTHLTDEEPELKVGDYAKVVNYPCVNKFKGIVRITETNRPGKYFPLRAELLDGSDDEVFDISQLVRATDEEVAAAKAQAEKEAEAKREASKWAKIGRKPGEYKKGDIVEITGQYTGRKYHGEIVGEVKSEVFKFNKFGADYNSTEYVKTAKLITPVESRFDLAQDDAK